jgi:hypothetical protein
MRFGSGANSASEAAERPGLLLCLVGGVVEEEGELREGVGAGAQNGAVAMCSRRRTASAGGACRCVRRGRKGCGSDCFCECGTSPLGISSSPKPESSPPTMARRSIVGCARRKARRAGVGSVRGAVDVRGARDVGDGVVGVLGVADDGLLDVSSGGKTVRLRRVERWIC